MTSITERKLAWTTPGLHTELTGAIIAAASQVHNTVGGGFLEKVYENALVIELRGAGFEVVPQAPIEVTYRGEPVGQFFADLCVGKRVIVEIKAVERLDAIHEVQLVNYLRATTIE